ncbi:methanol dehydrogenase [Mucilaginibacter sp. MD40]|uniref:TPM domain-containing protein n=1 Tax=Mucilaginibacter sp. MD40 TaxID=2029590 RepID=UPI000BAC5EB7|nr:TPM domain-containing protein [Mucilaginibacter sp. MD40]PAW92933.1 methanol dehydrogenase [Mucilaginibacter sp. MD40]
MFKKLYLFLGLLLIASVSFAQDIPQRSDKLVTDYTNTLSETDKQNLENKLVAYNDSTSTQIAIVMMQSTGDYDINQYATALLRKWGIGSKEKNNGVLILVAMKDRKMAISTGYGAEGSLPDIVTQQIIQNDMKPRFRENDYYGGLNAATDDIIKAMRGEYKADKKAGKKDGGSVIFVIIIVVIILIIIFKNRGGGGGGRRIIGSRGGADPFWWFLAGNMLGNSGRSSGSDWGGFSGGGSDWGGGGGGFGGFGGGSGGGGGSSGSW